MDVADTLLDPFIHGMPPYIDGDSSGWPWPPDLVFPMQQGDEEAGLVSVAGNETASLSSSMSSSTGGAAAGDLREHSDIVSTLIGSPGEISVKLPRAPSSLSPSSSLEYIYHMLFHDMDQLLADSALELHPPASAAIHMQRTTSSSRQQHSKRKREESGAPSAAPFDMEAILRAQQEFIQRRQIEEEYGGDKSRMSSLPKRCRKRMPPAANVAQQQHL